MNAPAWVGLTAMFPTYAVISASAFTPLYVPRIIRDALMIDEILEARAKISDCESLDILIRS